ncbi:hypothetical protein ACLB2K_061468 [Fragaria x ananassa]
MASKNTQAISTKKSKPTTSRSSSESSGHVTRSMARNQPTKFVALPSKPRKPIISLENLGESKHVSRSEERETLKKPRERSSSPTSDDESSTTSYMRVLMVMKTTRMTYRWMIHRNLATCKSW